MAPMVYQDNFPITATACQKMKACPTAEKEYAGRGYGIYQYLQTEIT